jgi:phage shock protein C
MRMNRRLYRSRTESVLGGVAGGVAEYLDVDPAIVRIIWAVLAVVTGGIFVVLYIVMWIVIPETPAGVPPPGHPASATGPAPGTPPTPGTAWTATSPSPRRSSTTGPVIFGLILIGLGVYFLVRQYLPAFDADLLWPIGLVVLGVLLLVVALRRREQ